MNNNTKLAGRALQAGVVAGAMLAGASIPSAAQGIEEIIVTARKRPETLASVPQTIAVFTAADLAAHGDRISGDLAQHTPNLMWHSIFGQATPQIFLRGVGNTTFNANQASPVGLHVDNVYQGSSATYGFGLLDLDRVEILKGPQGTLFGRNTTGGVINFVTRKADPAAGVNAQATATYGRFDEANLEIAAGAPIGEHAAFRVAGLTLNRSGYVTNAVPTSGIGRQGKLHLWSGRAQGRVLTESFDLLIEAHGGRNASDIIPGKQVGVVCPPGVAVPVIGACTDFLGFRDSTNLRESFAGTRSYDNIDTAGLSATATWHAPGFSVVSQTAFDSNHRRFQNDPDVAPATEIKANVVSRFHQFSQELRAASDAEDPLNWIVGGNYYRDSLNAITAFTLNALGPGVLSRFFPVQEGVATKLTQRSESTAVFGEAGYALTDQLTLTAGVRWTDDKRIADPYAFLINATGLANTFVDDTIATSRLLVPTIPAMHIERDWKRWGGRGMLGYQGSANLLAYASVTRGFKGGDFNGGAMFSPVEANIVDPEYVTACEIGVKGALPEARLSYGLAGFIYDFTNQQIATLIPGSNGALQNLTNAAKSNIHGLEAEIGLTPIDALRLDVKAGYLDAEFKKFQLDPGNPATNYAGNRIPSSPKFSLNALARYTVPLAAQRSLSFGAELSHKSAHFFTADNNRAMCENGYWILNADVTFALNEKVSVKAWARNLGDTKYFVSGIATTGFGVMELMPGLPRTYGVTASAKF